MLPNVQPPKGRPKDRQEPQPPSQPQDESQNYPWSSLGYQIAAHWEEHRPTMYNALKQQGELTKAVYEVQEMMAETLADLISKQGLRYDEAWEMVREIGFLPSEEDEPDLNLSQLFGM